jgi:cytochrome c oxidase cbb3-type subunit III
VTAPVRALSLALLLGAVACSKPAPPRPSADAGAPSSSAAPAAVPSSVAMAEGKAIVAAACLSCHGEDLLAQQRLPKEKWAATVKKMTGWGANLDSTDTAALVTYLAAMYGPDAGPWQPPPISAAAAQSALEPEPDGAYAGGDGARGREVYVAKCSACHGQNARGDVGVNLVERPLLYRAEEVAATVRKGRGKMAALPRTTDKDIGDILAHLRTLRVH